MIDAAIVGLGLWGRQLVRAVHGRSDSIRFTAAVEQRLNETAPFAGQHGLTLHEDYAQVLGDSASTAVAVSP